MSSKRGAWISRRGQVDAEAAIDQVIERQPGEQVRLLADELIEDSPYQARRLFSVESVDDLAQGMRETGFQGVLIVRPHGDGMKRREGGFQLVYGHRRRAAWRQVCAERGEPCMLPVVVREVSDERMLVIGAQENLQRQDLDPVEEGQIVAWHESMFFEKNQAEIGAMLGKSSDWVSVRSRVHKLPEALKERLRERPRSIKQFLELAPLYAHAPDDALGLAERVVRDNLTVEALRSSIRADDRSSSKDGEGEHKRRAGATFAPSLTSDVKARAISERTKNPSARGGDAAGEHEDSSCAALGGSFGTGAMISSTPSGMPDRAVAMTTAPTSVADDFDFALLLQKIAVSLDAFADQVEMLPMSADTLRALEQAEQALMRIRSALARRVP